MPRSLPTSPVHNTALTEALGSPVTKMGVKAIPPGAHIAVEFLDFDDVRPHGLWLAVTGALALDGDVAPQLRVWAASRGERWVVDVVDAGDGLLRYYNIFHKDGQAKSYMDKAGMLEQAEGPNTFMYSCRDYGESNLTTFNALRFRLSFV